MKKVFLLLTLAVLMFGAACKPLETPPVTDAQEAMLTPDTESKSPEEDVQEPEPVEPVVAEPVEQVTIDYAKNFTIEYREGYKLLTVTTPWAGAEQSFSYALVPEEFAGMLDVGNAMLIKTPIKSIVTFSTTYYPFLEQIGQLESVIGIDTSMFAYNQNIRTWAEAGAIKEVGGGASMAPVDVEAVIELAPDAIMTSASGIPEYDVHPQLLEAGLPVVLNADYLEPHPLGRAEWGKFIAAFYDKEVEAAKLFDELVDRYEEAKMKVIAISYAPSVFLNTAWEDSWSVPQKDSYVGILLRDAGARYLFDDQEGSASSYLGFETVLDVAKEATFWLNPGMATDLASLSAMDARYADFAAFKSGEVYNTTARVTDMGGSDYYESGVANPDKVLMDLIAILHPGLLEGYELYYYKQLN
jgi:iron complex transport system substrate-binding protein